MDVEALIEKIRGLSPERAAEVEDFLDFLPLREEESRLTLAAARLSEEVFAEVWDNPEDAVYDELRVRGRRSRPVPLRRSDDLEEAA